jgi:hypothetical protein
MGEMRMKGYKCLQFQKLDTYPLWEEVDMGDQRIVDLAPAKAPWSTHNQHHPDAVIGQVALFVPML